MNCIRTRSSKPLLLLVRTEKCLSKREALDDRRDEEAAQLLDAMQQIRRLACELIQSDLYGGPLLPGTKDFVRGSMKLMSIDTWLTHRLAEARARSSSAESQELRAAHRTIDRLLSDLLESWRRARNKEGVTHED